MFAFRREAVALVVIAFHFLVLEQQTQASRFQWQLLLQHLKRSRRRRLILLQIAFQNRRRARRAWSWPRLKISYKELSLNDRSGRSKLWRHHLHRSIVMRRKFLPSKMSVRRVMKRVESRICILPGEAIDRE